MSLLILGGDGSLTNIILKYLSRDYQIYVIGRKCPYTCDSANFLHLDLSRDGSYETIMEYLKDIHISHIFDCASNTSPSLNYEFNIRIVELAIRLCRTKDSTYMRLSTLKTKNRDFSGGESDYPNSCYAWSKAYGDLMIRKESNLRYIILRPAFIITKFNSKYSFPFGIVANVTLPIVYESEVGEKIRDCLTNTSDYLGKDVNMVTGTGTNKWILENIYDGNNVILNIVPDWSFRYVVRLLYKMNKLLDYVKFA